MSRALRKANIGSGTLRARENICGIGVVKTYKQRKAGLGRGNIGASGLAARIHDNRLQRPPLGIVLCGKGQGHSQ